MESSIARQLDHRLIERLRDNLIDLDIVADDLRNEIADRERRLEIAIQERDRVARDLEWQIRRSDVK
jgi:hypothetical protein